MFCLQSNVWGYNQVYYDDENLKHEYSSAHIRLTRAKKEKKRKRGEKKEKNKIHYWISIRKSSLLRQELWFVIQKFKIRPVEAYSKIENVPENIALSTT